MANQEENPEVPDGMFGGTIVHVKDHFGFVQLDSVNLLPDGYGKRQIYFSKFAFKGGKDEMSVGLKVILTLSDKNPLKPSAKEVFSWNGYHAHKQQTEKIDKERQDPTQTLEDHAQKKRKRKRMDMTDVVQSPRRQKGKFLRGKVTSIKDNKFGFLSPLEKLPSHFAQRDVYFKVEKVHSGGMVLVPGDVVEFRLGSLETDLERPSAFDCRVTQFIHRNDRIIADFISTLKTNLSANDEEEHGKGRDVLPLLSCPACWRAVGNCTTITNELMGSIIDVIIDLKARARGFQSHFVAIMNDLSETKLFNPWDGALKRYIETTFDYNVEERIEAVQKFLVIILHNIPTKSRAITTLLKPLVNEAGKCSKVAFLYNIMKAMSRSSSSDIEDMEWDEMPLVPTSGELASPIENIYMLNPVKKDTPYKTPHEYMDTYFRLLRADCFSKLREGLHDLFEGKLDPRDMNVYHSVKMVGLEVSMTGLAIALKVVPQREVKNWAVTSNLMFGNLLCLSPCGTFKDPIWATVVTRDEEMLAKNQTIFVELCSDINNVSVGEIIHILTQASGSVLMVESPTYYKAYQPVLRVLQSTDPENLPFKEQLINVDPSSLAGYVQEQTTVDGSIIFNGIGITPLDEFIYDYSLQEGMQTTLDDSQRKAIQKSLDKKLAIIQGPPGTGKTFIGLKLLELIKSMSTRDESPVLVLTYKNHALDEFLKDALKLYPGEVARIGGRSKEPELESCNLKECVKKAPMDKAIWTLRQNLMSELDELQPEIKRLAKENHAMSKLQLKTIVDNLHNDQIQQLVNGCDWSKQTLQLKSLDVADKILPEIKHALEKLYMERHNYISQADISRILQRCHRVISSRKDNMSKSEVKKLISEIDSELCASLRDEFDDIENFLLDISSDINALLSVSNTTNNDVACLMKKVKTPIQGALFNQENTVISNDILNTVTTAIKAWLPTQKVFQAVNHPFAKVIQTKTTLDDKTNTIRYKDDEIVTDEHDIAEEELERMSSMAMSKQSRGRPDDQIMFKSERGLIDVPLLQNANEVVNHYSTIGIINTSNLWELSDEERVVLIQILMMKEIEKGTDALDESLSKYQDIISKKQELDVLRNVNALRNKAVIGVTVTGANIHHDLLTHLKPSIVIVEEAAEVLEPQLISVLGPWVQQLILIGDHRQLRPSVETYALKRDYNFDISLMERLINNRMPYATLSLQNRMRPEFAELLKDIYPHLKSNIPRVSKHKQAPCVVKSMYFWDHNEPEQDSRSFKNDGEAKRVVAFAIFLLCQGYLPSQITILAGYQGQTSLLRKLVRQEEEKHPNLFSENADAGDAFDKANNRPKMKIHTIDLYQGDENDIVIISLVRSNNNGAVGFLKLLNRRCVAQSRSRCGLYFVGNRNTLCSSEHWHKLIEKMSKSECVGPELPLCCPKHPDTTQILARTPFEIPTGSFCTERCSEKMPCKKHLCRKSCQPPHKHTQCDREIVFTHARCNHKDIRKCFQEETDIVCHTNCEFTFPCGHAGKRKCYQSQQTIFCKERVLDELKDCGHIVSRKCTESIKDIKCDQPCTAKLSCGHPCALQCGRPCCGVECDVCKKIKKEKDRQLQEETRKKYMAIIATEVEEIKKHTQTGLQQIELSAEGDTASEYHDVADRVKKYVQPGHNWFPQIDKITKIVNYTLQLQWWNFRKTMIDPGRSELKFHGTDEAATQAIAENGFRLPQRPGMYGKGIYFATDSSKSAQDIYTKGSDQLLICDVLLGKSKTVDRAHKDMTAKRLKEEGYDSLYAKRGTRETGGVMYDEFVVYHKHQALPKYIVKYVPTDVRDFDIGTLEREAVAKNSVICKHITQTRSLGANNEEDLHFRIAESQFLRLVRHGRSTATADVKSVDYYINPLLVNKFNQKMKDFKTKYGNHEESKYILAFHGTREENIQSIVTKNFSIDKLSANTGDKGYYGAGIYFSEFPTISLGYGKKLLLCKVLPGRPFDCKQEDMMLGGKLQQGYESHRVHADSKGRGYEIVIFNPDQILPCYVINT